MTAVINIIVKRFDTNWMLELCDIEAECFTEPWNGNQFLSFLEDGGKIKLAFTELGDPVGYYAAMNHKGFVSIVGIAVVAPFRFNGIGRLLLQHASFNIMHSRRRCLKAVVHEANAGAAEFFAACNFSSSLLHSPYVGDEDDDLSDAYLFEQNIYTERSNRIGRFYQGCNQQ